VHNLDFAFLKINKKSNINQKDKFIKLNLPF